MLWSFMAVVFSGWLYVDASYRGPVWQRWLFKPVTLLLLLALSWQVPVQTLTSYLVILGLLSSLIGDALLMLPAERKMYAIGAFFLANLLYTIGFSSHMTLTVFWPLPVTLLVIGAVLIALLWPRLEDLRWPVAAYIGMTLLMVWVVGEQYFLHSSAYNLSLLAGTLLLLLAASIWLVSHYRYPFHTARALAAAGYFAGHFLIVRSLYL